MHKETFAHQTELLWNLSAASDIIVPASGFHLTGSTSLACQQGHCQSEDLDFFTQNELLPARITERMQNLGTLQISQAETRTVRAVLNDVKFSFVSYLYLLHFPPLKVSGRELGAC